VLLNVVAATNGIDAAMHLGSNSQRLRREMKKASVLIIGNFRDDDLFAICCEHAEIVIAERVYRARTAELS